MTITALHFRFSGMGQSDWREMYTQYVLADEVVAVAEATGLFNHAEKPLIAAHSFGGSSHA